MLVMKINDKMILIDKILYTINDIRKTRGINSSSIVENVAKTLDGRNIPNPKMLLNGGIPLGQISIQVLYHLTKALYQETQRELIKPNKYFTDFEIQQLDLFKYQIEELDRNKITEFNNARQVSDDQWHVIMSIQEIAKLFELNRISYNPSTQRESIFREHEDVVIVRPKVYTKNITEICKNMLNGTYIPDEITFNILLDGKEDYDYKNGNLIVHSGQIDVIDGYHRSRAIIDAVSQNRDLKMNMEVRITHFTIEKAQRFIVQKNKQQKIDERHIKSIDNSKYEHAIVKRINESGKSDFQGKIATTSMSIRTGVAFVGFDLLSDVVKYNFIDSKIVRNRKDVEKISNYLIDFMNEIYSIYYDEFEKEKRNLINHNFGYIGFIALAAELYKDNHWEEKLKNTLNKIDFSIGNTNYRELIINEHRISYSTIKKVSKYFQSFLK